MSVRLKELQRWNYRCGNCEMNIEKNPVTKKYLFERDHFFPLSMGGDDNTLNTWPLCLNCHRVKTQMEKKEKYNTPWCIICKKYYNEKNHSCYKKRRDDRLFLSCKDIHIDDFPHPDKWMEVFSFDSSKFSIK